MGTNFNDEIECGSFFDNCDDLIEFPTENECGIGSFDCNDFPPIWTDHLNDFLISDPFLSGGTGKSNTASNLSAELSIPYEDMVQLEWLSTFMEDSFSGGGMTLVKKEISSVDKESSCNKFQTSSPVSVLESSSSSSSGSCSRGKTLPLSTTLCGTQRARSKRPRPATFSRRSAIQLVPLTSDVAESCQPFAAPVASSESDNFAESYPMKKLSKPATVGQKKREKKKLSVSGSLENQNPPSQALRKCLHCEVTKTPQWRAGPMGPKTLCNACGVRYKSERLFPEYRPAASPTFVPSVHSNSHRKVLEMRSKAVDTNCLVSSAGTTQATTELQHIPYGDLSRENM